MANNNSRFLLGLAQSITSGVKSRQDEERAMASKLSEMIMKAKMEQELISSTRPQGGRVSGYKYTKGQGYVPEYAGDMTLQDILEEKIAERRLGQMRGQGVQGQDGGAMGRQPLEYLDIKDFQGSVDTPTTTVGDIAGGQFGRGDKAPSQFIDDFEYVTDKDTGVVTKVPKRVPNPAFKEYEERGKGLSIETGGKLAMVQQAKQDIGEVRTMLFPDGTPKSFKRGLATMSNLPGSRAPLVGAIIPQAMPFHESGQKIYSRLQNAVAAKLRVETGAQANPSEVENILARFGVTGASSPEAAWDALNRLEDFMDKTITVTDPKGRFGGSKKSLSQPQNNDPLGLR